MKLIENKGDQIDFHAFFSNNTWFNFTFYGFELGRLRIVNQSRIGGSPLVLDCLPPPF